MLTGQYNHTVDSKGRVFIPAKFRTDLGQHVTVTTIFGDYICIYADEEWAKAVTEQLYKCQHTSNLYYSEPCVSLAKLLCEKYGFSQKLLQLCSEG